MHGLRLELSKSSLTDRHMFQNLKVRIHARANNSMPGEKR